MKKIIIAIITVIVIALAGFSVWFLQDSQKPFAGETESIVIGAPSLVDTSGLVYIADEQNFFGENGLDVTLKEYDTGVNAVNGTLNGENDIALATEFVIVENAFKHEKVVGIGSISKSDTFEIIGRRDRGIVNASDLRGKKIGMARGTISDFYLGRYLELHGINLTDITIIDLKSSQLTNAIDNGTVDAIIAWEPYAYTIKEQQGSNAVSLPAQSGQLTYWAAICGSDWASQHPELISRFLKSIDQAVAYAINHPAEFKAILKKRMHANETYVDIVWNQTHYGLSLDESLIMAIEDEGRWMINNNLTSEKENPNLRKYFYLDGLVAIKPESVNVIR